MVERIARKPGELELLLEEQVEFLKGSAAAYDAGFHGEAKRLAVSIRVLLHDTGKSHSLLGLLGRKEIPFFQSAYPTLPGSVATYSGLVAVGAGPDGASYMALLDDAPTADWLSFEAWWEMPVFKDKHAHLLSRRDLVLFAANQDGGAHVDQSLDARYSALSRDHSMNWTFTTPHETRLIEGAERAAMRQIAHEVLRTLDTDYRKAPDYGKFDFMVGGVSIVRGQSAPEVAKPFVAPRHVGRNAQCPCGSGLKFKKCHGKLA